MKRIFALFAVFAAVFVPYLAFAQDIPVTDWLSQVFEAVKSLGGLSWGAKVGVICSLLVGSMKVTILRDWVWDKLGGFKFLASPVFALLGGLAALWVDGKAPSVAILSAYFLAGLGGNLLKDLLENVKKIPGIGDGVVKVINLIEQLMTALSIGSSKSA